MPPQAHWTPTAHAFAHHQFSHVANFWKQGREASFRLEALPGGRAELNLTFKLPSASEVIPPPSHVPTVPAHQRPIQPLFPKGCFPQGSDLKSKPTSPKVASRRQRKNYQRSVLHRAALAAASTNLPPPKTGSLRQAASACVQRLQTAKKRALDSTTSPSKTSPLAQRLRSDFKIGDSEIESPERELLRSRPSPEKPPSPVSPSCVKSFPPPAPLALTPAKLQEYVEEPAFESRDDSDWETVEECENDFENDFPTIDVDCEDWADKFTESIQRFHSSGKVVNCENCDEVFTRDHQC